MKKKKIVFTGGGTAGHVTPNLALIDSLHKNHWDIHYIGSDNGIEKTMIQAIKIPFYGIRSGKLRRYFSWKNFIDPFNVLVGLLQSYRLLRKLKPDVVFSKGGFVALPVVIAAYLNRIPVVAHESDISPGLANRLSFPFVTKICVTFEAAKNHFKRKDKIEVTGTPIREELLQGNKEKGLLFCGFTTQMPCILIVGGSQGSSSLNKVIREGLNDLSAHYQVIHICGKDKLDPSYKGKPHYFQIEYANEELSHLLAASDLVISRSGANSLYELLVLAKPHILVPLSGKVSRGDQIQNARYYQNLGTSIVINDETISSKTLIAAIHHVFENQEVLVAKIKALNIQSATDKIIRLLEIVSCNLK